MNIFYIIGVVVVIIVVAGFLGLHVWHDDNGVIRRGYCVVCAQRAAEIVARAAETLKSTSTDFGGV